MSTDSPLIATASESSRFPTGLAPVFRHDQFLIGLKLAVADKRTISDAQGRPLLIVTSPSRLGRIVAGPCHSCLTIADEKNLAAE
jgi:hypothetical protein